MSRWLSFAGEAYHGTTGDIAKRIASAGGSLLSEHGRVGPGVYVAPEQHTAERYGDFIFGGEANARKVMPADHFDREFGKHIGQPGSGQHIRQALLKDGYDGVEDPTEWGSVALLHPHAFNIRSVYHPEEDRWMHPAELEGQVTRPRRRNASAAPRSQQFDRLWSPQTFGN